MAGESASFHVKQGVRPTVAIQRRTTDDDETLRQIEAQSRFIGFINVKAYGGIVRRGQAGAGMPEQGRTDALAEDIGIEKQHFNAAFPAADKAEGPTGGVRRQPDMLHGWEIAGNQSASDGVQIVAGDEIMRCRDAATPETPQRGPVRGGCRPDDDIFCTPALF